LAVRVTAKRKGFTPSSITLPTSGPVVRGELTPVETPVVSGDPYVNKLLTASPGAWSPAPAESEIRWRADNKAIEGATGPTLTVTRALVGKRITAVSVAWRDGYWKAVSKSAPIGPVVLGTIEVAEPFTAAGSSRVGSRMWIEPGTFTPADATVSYAWLRDGVPIPGATGPSHDVVPADAGSRITAQVTLSKPNYQQLVQRFEIGGPVTTKPKLRITTKQRRGAAVVAVKVVAPGVNNPGGQVQVRIGKQRQVLRPTDARARFVIEGLRPKKHRVYVAYTGTDVVERRRGSAYIRIRR
jgi:hypothetical protein